MLHLCTSPDYALYSTKFHKNISKGFRVIGRTLFPNYNWRRAQHHQKYRRINGPYSLHITWWCFIFVPNIMKVSQKVSQLLSRHISQLKFSKGHDSVKIIGEVTILVLCTLPDGALYLY